MKVLHSFACFLLRANGNLANAGRCSDCLMRPLQRSDLFTAPNLSFDASLRTMMENGAARGFASNDDPWPTCKMCCLHVLLLVSS